MAILNIYLDLDKEYIDLIKDLYKIIVIFVVFQIIMVNSNTNKNILVGALSGNLLNDNFMTLLIYIIISVIAYYLIFDKLISFQ